MSWVSRPAIGADISSITAVLFGFLGAVMTRFAQALQWAKDEQVPVTTVRLQVVGYAGRGDHAAIKA